MYLIKCPVTSGMMSAGASPPEGNLLHWPCCTTAAIVLVQRCTLLHPFHHHVQQGLYRFVHAHARHGAGLKIGDAGGKKNKKQCDFYQLKLKSIYSTHPYLSARSRACLAFTSLMLRRSALVPTRTTSGLSQYALAWS